MTVQELIDRLSLCRKDNEIRFYYLKNNNLNGCNLETLIQTKIGLELTIQDEEEREVNNNA